MDKQIPTRSLSDVRIDIDKIDTEIIQLLNKRVELAQEIGQIKGVSSKPFFTPERERQIYEKLKDKSSDLLQIDQLTAIFREIISAGRAAEKALQVSYWGPEGTYTHQAGIKAFGHSVLFDPAYNIRDVFLAVERKNADYGIVPIENSSGGIVPETLDMFPQTDVKIISETFLDIHHHLGTQAEDFSQIKRIFAGPQPSAQCREWLRAHVPHAEIIDVVPTAKAVQLASEDPQSAAIANQICLDLYGLPALAENIQDSSHNRTRFVVIGYNEPTPSGRDKTSLMFKVRNRRGELYHILGCFVEHEVNLTMIESRPDPRSSFQYLFYVDCEGHQKDSGTMRAINDLRSVAIETVILGSYPSYDEGLHSL